MAPNSKPPSAYQPRPPLTSRIRASFEGKRTKSVSRDGRAKDDLQLRSPTAASNGSPTVAPTDNGFFVPDADTLRNAIEHAVNSETFQKAIAAHLAKIIKPSIKSALDTIQPVVEAVYTHEMLLRKTNQSVENVLDRLTDTNASRRTSRVDPDEGGVVASALADPPPPGDGETTPVPREILGGSSPDLDQFKKSPAGEAPNLSPFEPQITSLASTLEAHTAALEEIKTASAAHTAALEGHSITLEGLKSLNVAAAPPADGQSNTSLEPQITSIISTLEVHTVALGELITSSGAHATALESHGTALEEIKSVRAGCEPIAAMVDLAPLEAQVAAIITTLEAHSSSLDEIKTSTAFHSTTLEGHGAALENIKSLGGGEAPATEGNNLSNLQAQITAVIETLQTHTAALDELKGTTKSYVTTLAESRSIEPAPAEGASNLTELESKVGAIASTLEAHDIVLEEIKTTGGSHTSSLDEIKTAQTSHAKTLDEIKTTSLQHASVLEDIRSPGLPPIPAMGMGDTSNVAALEIQIGSIINTLNTHTGALADIGTRVGNSSYPLIAGGDISTPPSINTIIEILDAHTAVLSEIKEDVSAEILTALHNLDQKQDNHNYMLTEIREADLNEEILTLLHASGESHAEHAAALEKIQEAVTASNESHAAHNTSLEEIKAKGVGSDEMIPAQVVDFSGVQAQIVAMMAVLEEHKASLASIKDTATASHELHVSHGSYLDEIKSRFVEPASTIEIPGFEGMEGKIDTLIASLDEQKATLSAIKDTTTASHGLHAAHIASLDELKSRSVEPATAPDFSGTEAKIDIIVASLDEHNATLTSIQESTSDLNDLYASHTASLEELKSRSVEPGVAPASAVEMPDFSSLETQIEGIIANLEEHKATLAAIQELSTAHAVSLEDVKTKSIDPEQIGDIITSLDEHKTTLSAIQEATTASHELHLAHGSSLDDIKSKTADPEHIASIATSLEEHTTTLATIKDMTAASHDLHVTHASSLDEIKSRSIDAVPESLPSVNIEGLEAQIGSIITMLEEQKTVLSELREATTGFSEAHASHTSILTEIKDNTVKSNESHASHIAITTQPSEPAPTEPSSPDLSTLETHLNAIITTLESQTITLSELKEKPDQASPEILDAIKRSHDLLTTNYELFSSHTTLLDAIKEGTSHEDIIANLTELKTLVQDSKTGIDEHGILVKDLHSEAKDNQSNLTAAIAGLALGAAAGAGGTVLSNDDESSPGLKEILEEVKAIHAIVESTKEGVTSMQAQIDIDHTTVTTSLGSLGDEIKAEIDASVTNLGEKIDEVHEVVRGIDLAPVHTALKQHGTTVQSISSQLEGIDGSVKVIDLAPVHTALEQHGATMQSISSQLKGVDGSVKAIDLNSVHTALEQHGEVIQCISSQLEGLGGNIKVIDITPLQNGVHLNETGLWQLKEHVVSRTPIAEGTWFKRTPSAERKDPIESHASIPAAVAGLTLGVAGAWGNEGEEGEIPREEAYDTPPGTEIPESEAVDPPSHSEETIDDQPEAVSHDREPIECEESKNMNEVDREPETVTEEQNVDTDLAVQQESTLSDLPAESVETKEIEHVESEPEPVADLQVDAEPESQEKPAQIDVQSKSDESKEIESIESKGEELDAEPEVQEDSAPIESQPESEEIKEVESVEPSSEHIDDVQVEAIPEIQEIGSTESSEEVMEADLAEPDTKSSHDQVEPDSDLNGDVQGEQESDSQELEQLESSEAAKEADIDEPESELSQESVENPPFVEEVQESQPEHESQDKEPAENQPDATDADQPTTEIEYEKELKLVESENKWPDEPIETSDDPAPRTENEKIALKAQIDTETAESEPIEHSGNVNNVPVPETSEPGEQEPVERSDTAVVSIKEPIQDSEAIEPSEEIQEPQASEEESGLKSDDDCKESRTPLDGTIENTDLIVPAEPSQDEPSQDEQEIPISDDIKEGNQASEDPAKIQDEDAESEPVHDPENPESEETTNDTTTGIENPEAPEKSDHLDENESSGEQEIIHESDAPVGEDVEHPDKIFASDHPLEENERTLDESPAVYDEFHEESSVPENSRAVETPDNSENIKETSSGNVPAGSEELDVSHNKQVAKRAPGEDKDVSGGSESIPSAPIFESTEPKNDDEVPALETHEESSEEPSDLVVQDESEHHQEDVVPNSEQPSALGERESDEISPNPLAEESDLPVHGEKEEIPASDDGEGEVEKKKDGTGGDKDIDDSQQLEGSPQEDSDVLTNPRDPNVHHENLSFLNEHLDENLDAVPDSVQPEPVVLHEDQGPSDSNLDEEKGDEGESRLSGQNENVPTGPSENIDRAMPLQEEENSNHQLSDDEILEAQAHSTMDGNEDPEEFRRMLEHQSPSKNGQLEPFDAHDPTEQEYLSDGDVKPEGALSPIEESPTEGVHAGVEDPFESC